MRKNRGRSYSVLVAAGLALAAVPAQAAPLTFAGVLGNLSAEVNFEASGTNLVVTLTNTSSSDVLLPNEILTAVYYSVLGGPLSLGRTGAVVPVGSTVLFGGTDPGSVVGGEWAYYESATNTPFGQNSAISSAGLGVSGVGGLFPGTNLQGPASPDGLQYGLTSAGDDPGTGNTPVTGTNALIKNSVVFTLSGLPVGFDPSQAISSVQFQYGTANCNSIAKMDHCIPDYPEPATILSLALGALALRPRRR